VQVVWDPDKTTLSRILQIFWESHDPTQGHRQGNDVGTQYRSAVYWTDAAQRDAVLQSRDRFQDALRTAKLGEVTTELAASGETYFAEEHHQQYLSKNPGGYCGLGGTGVSCPIGIPEIG
jgi:peptide-methionine (S)-S-oxide reductase